MGVVHLLNPVLSRLEARSPTLAKLFRYSAASAVAVTTYVVVLVLCHVVIGLPEMTSHLTAVFVSSVPNYLINRSWTWNQQGKNRLWGEVVPFWVMAFLGLVLSTIFVAIVDRRTDSTAAIAAANLSAFGVLWLAKFVVLDKLMWKVVHDLHPELDIEDPSGETPLPVSADG